MSFELTTDHHFHDKVFSVVQVNSLDRSRLDLVVLAIIFNE